MLPAKKSGKSSTKKQPTSESVPKDGFKAPLQKTPQTIKTQRTNSITQSPLRGNQLGLLQSPMTDSEILGSEIKSQSKSIEPLLQRSQESKQPKKDFQLNMGTFKSSHRLSSVTQTSVIHSETSSQFKQKISLAPVQPDKWKELQHAYMNEKVAPQILDYKEFLVEQIKKILEIKKDMINQLRKSGNEIEEQIHQIDYCNGLYLLKSYLRCRIEKIKDQWIFLSNEENRSSLKLAAHEIEFYRDFFYLRVGTLKSQYLKDIPKQFNPFLSSKKTKKMSQADRPNFRKKVLCEIVDPQNIGFGGMNMFNIVQNRKEGEIYQSRYSIIKNLVANNRVVLL